MAVVVSPGGCDFDGDFDDDRGDDRCGGNNGCLWWCRDGGDGERDLAGLWRSQDRDDDDDDDDGGGVRGRHHEIVVVVVVVVGVVVVQTDVEARPVGLNWVLRYSVPEAWRCPWSTRIRDAADGGWGGGWRDAMVGDDLLS
jgi:hypothetical protein